jgi:hypothetical protein
MSESSRRSSLSAGAAAQQFDGLDQLDPVAGGAAQGLAHVGEQGHGAGSGGFGGGHHQGGEILGVFLLAEECAGAGFYVEDQGVEAGGELSCSEDGGADEAGAFDGAGAVAQCIEDAVGGDQRGGLADDGAPQERGLSQIRTVKGRCG